MASKLITSQPTQIIFQSIANASIIQNTGNNIIYIADNQSVSATSNATRLLPGETISWTDTSVLYAVCDVGLNSYIDLIVDGASLHTSVYSLLNQTKYLRCIGQNNPSKSTYGLAAGIYTFTTLSTTAIFTIDFYDVNGAIITTATSTANTPLVVNLGTNAAFFYYWTPTAIVTDLLISFTLSGQPVSFQSGVITTVTTSGTIQLSGTAYVVVIGAGGGGGGGTVTAGGGGGGSGGTNYGRMVLTPGMACTIGTGGLSGSSGANGAAGGGSSIGLLSTTGGQGGIGNGGAGGTGGTSGGGAGGAGGAAGGGAAGSASIVITFPPIFGLSTGGGGGGGGVAGNAGAGSGIGTGGTGGTSTGGVATNPTGYGSGGGGGAINGSGIGNHGTPGANGVIYIIQ